MHMGKITILIIDDEKAIRSSLRGILEDEDYIVLDVSSGEEALSLLEKNVVDLCFLDVWLEGADGIDVLSQVHKLYPEMPIVMISGHGTIETAVKAIRFGAYDFIEKPLSLEKILISVLRATELGKLKKENLFLKVNARQGLDSWGIIGESAALLEIKEQIMLVAPTDASVLITGENGTGKELAAKAIHTASNRNQKAFIAVNCAAIPEDLIESELFGHEKGAFTGAEKQKIGRFEMAEGGTIFLDEIGDMSFKTQSKILRVLQERTFERVGGVKTMSLDVRVIAATNKNLELGIKEGTFREDLYYRLCVFPLQLSPLRQRKQDIPLLLEYYVKILSKQYNVASVEFTKEAIEKLQQYNWPGNIRELRNCVERMLILSIGGKITLESLRSNFMQEDCSVENMSFMEHDYKTSKMLFEKEYLQKRLKLSGGNITKLAESIGLERSYVHKKLKQYNLESKIIGENE
ncbi:MAG: sigma-54-dependent transcriptional regulator [Desulfovibrionaceae bacterium]